MWIKICANTNLEDALLAAELGADAVGFVFAPSGRRVTLEQAAEIIQGLPEKVEKIGVFATQDAGQILRIAKEARLTGVQLHGHLDFALAALLRDELGEKISIIQTLHWGISDGARHAEVISDQLNAIANMPAVDRVLIDSNTSKGSGGTGVAFEWIAARAAFSNSKTRLILAGGLRPHNVATAITTLEAWGVDVASGVEAVVGRKDSVKLKLFIQNARSHGSEETA